MLEYQDINDINEALQTPVLNWNTSLQYIV